MVVEGQQIVTARFKGIGLTDELERTAGILGEDDNVFGGIGIEELQDGFSGVFN